MSRFDDRGDSGTAIESEVIGAAANTESVRDGHVRAFLSAPAAERSGATDVGDELPVTLFDFDVVALSGRSWAARRLLVDVGAYRQATAAWFSLIPPATRPLDGSLRRLEVIARVALPPAMWITGCCPHFRSEELFAAHPDQLATLAVRALARRLAPEPTWSARTRRSARSSCRTPASGRR